MEPVILLRVGSPEWDAVIKLVAEQTLKIGIELGKGLSKDKMLNSDEVAVLLKCTKSHVYKLTSQLLVPHFKVGKRICFSEEEILKWMKTIKVKTHGEIEQEAINYLATSKFKKRY